MENDRAKSEITWKGAAFFDRVLDGSVWVGCIFVALSWLGVLVDIFMRKVFIKPQPWITELSTVLMLQLTVLPSAWLLRKGRHVIVDIVVQQIPKESRQFIHMITSFVFAAVCLFVTVVGGIATWKFFNLGYCFEGAIDIKMWLVTWAIPVGFFMLFIQFLREAYAYGRRKKDLGKWEGDIL